MSHKTAARTRIRRLLGLTVVVMVIVAAVIVGVLAAQPGSSAARSFGEMFPGGAATEADGVLPDGATLADDGYAGIANLNPALVQALRDAATAAAAEEGIEFLIIDGWRSPAYQDQLLREAVSSYGSAEEAARWVATPEASAHVSGDAVDVGPFDATYWLSQYGAAYGLCQVYVNEPWHYELLPEAVDQGCPAMYADPTEDPRMQQ